MRRRIQPSANCCSLKSINNFNINIVYRAMFLCCLAIVLTLGAIVNVNAQCPTIFIDDLRGVPGYPEVNEVTVCGVPDTISIYINNTSGQVLSFSELTLNIPVGYEYAGDFGFFDPNYPVNQGSVADLNNPSFTLPTLGADSVQIVWFTITATCDIYTLPSSTEFFFGSTFDFFFNDPVNGAIPCSETWTGTNDYGLFTRRPSLNIISVSPIAANITTADFRCSNVTIRQTGIDASITEFDFGIDAVHLAPDFALSINIGGVNVPFTYNPGTMEVDAVIGSSYFTGGTLDENEQVVVQVCYEQLLDCATTKDIFDVTYNASFGCGGATEPCTDPSVAEGSYRYAPNFQNTPQITGTNIQTPQICGDNAIFELTFKSNRTDPLRGRILNFEGGIQICEGDAFEAVSAEIVGGSAFAASDLYFDGTYFMASALNFTADPDGAGGLSDTDGDGFFDDLPGGESITIRYVAAIKCQSGPISGCADIDCEANSAKIKGERNCGDPFNLNRGITPTVFSYGNIQTTINPDTIAVGAANVATFNFGLGNTGENRVDVEFCYEFGSNGVTPCGNSDVHFELDISGDPRVVKDMQIDPTTAMYNGIPVPASDISVTTNHLDQKTVKLDVGSTVAGLVCYNFEMVMDSCLCYPRTYVSGNFRVVENCNDCAPTCTLVRACEAATFSSVRNCSCSCFISGRNSEARRADYGFTDATMTTPVDTSLISSIEKRRLLPCDSLYVHSTYKILDPVPLNDAHRMYFYNFGYATSGRAYSPGLELLPDYIHARMLEFSFEKASNPGILVPIDLSACNASGQAFLQFRGGNSIAGATLTTPANSSADALDNEGVHLIVLDRETEFANGSPTNVSGQCLTEMKNQMGGLEIGDQIHVKFNLPLQKNPYKIENADIAARPDEDLLINQWAASYAYVNGVFTNLGGNCQTTTPIELHCPDPLTAVTNFTESSCGATVSHTIDVSDSLPASWYPNEFRPYYYFDSLSIPLYSPFVFGSNLSATYANGNTTQLSQPTYDATTICVFDPVTSSNCCTPSGARGQMFLDKSEFEPLGVGLGATNDQVVISYDLKKICPGSVPEPQDYELGIVYSLPCSFASGGYRCNYHIHPSPTLSFFVDNSGNTYPVPECNGGGPGTAGYNTLKFDEKDYHLDTITGTLNYISGGTNPGPLTCTIQKDFVSDAAGASEFNTYEVCAGAGGAHTNVVTSISLPPTVQLINVTTGIGGPVNWTLTGTDATSSTYYVETPDLSTGDCFEIIIETELLFCPTEEMETEVCISTASGCLSPELTSQLLAGGGAACTSAMCCYEYISGEAEVQNTWETKSPKYANLCDTVHLEILIKNVKEAILTGLETQFVLPPGLTFVPGSFEYVYPGISGAPGTSMPDPTSGGTSPFGPSLSIFDASIPPILQNGLPGILAPAGDNLLIYRFIAETNCNEYVSNTPFYVLTEADDPCEKRIGSGWVPHPGIIINGADPADFAQFVINMDPIDYSCGGPVPVSFSAVNLSTTGGVSNMTTTCMTFPSSLTYTPGSFVFTSPGGFTPTNVSEIVLPDGRTEVCFDIPDGLSPQQSFAGTVELEVDPTVECGEVLVEALIMSKVETIVCSTTGVPCDVFVNNSINQYLVLQVNPPLQIGDVEMVVQCDSDPLSASFEYEVTVETGTTPYSGPVTIEFVYDVDQNGQIDSYDQIIYSTSTTVALGADTMAVIDGNTPRITEEFTCPLLVNLTIDPNCNCDSDLFEYNGTPKPDFLAGLTDPLVICPGETVDLATCDGYSFTYLTPSSLAAPVPDQFGVVSLGGYTTSPVELAVTGGTAGCDTTWIIEIIQLDDFTLDDGAAIVCNLECTQLDAGIPEEWIGAVSINWSPGTYLDDSTSATPMICNPDANITYTIEITNPADCLPQPPGDFKGSSFNNNCCMATATFSVTVLSPPIPSIVCDAKYGECYFPEDPPTITVDPGFSNYDFFYASVSGGPAVLVQSGPNNVHIAANVTGYYTATVTNGICLTPLDTVFKMELVDCCEMAMDDPLAFCCIITDSMFHESPLATWDCDMGGVDNLTECLEGGDPGDDGDDCQIAAEQGMDICAVLDPDENGVFDDTHPWATQDCDGGGVSNIDECIAGTDPSDPSDDPTCPCHDAELGNIDICAILAADPMNPIGTLDCDEGGVDNATECAEGGDPLDPADDCAMAQAAGIDLCQLLTDEPDNPLATQDCDDGGVDNITECNAGEDPFNPADDCDAALAQMVNICQLINSDPMHPMAMLDCDNGGVDNYTECINGGDPSDPADDCEFAGEAGISICMVLDPDGNGTFDDTHPWATLDCDGGGVDNITECITGDDPSNPSDDPQCPCDEAEAGDLDICALLAADPTNPIGTLDCDDGGVDNATECANGGNPVDASDDCDMWQFTNIDLCVLLAGDPMHPLASVDCDGGGVTNIEECDSGEDPFDPADDCQSAIDNDLDICAIVLNDPMGMMATLDCDSGGVDNITECQNGGDPGDPADDCDAASNSGVDICMMLDPEGDGTFDDTHPWASLDCDGGGVSNVDECIAGTDPNEPSDDPTCACHDAEQGTIDICTILAADPTNPLGTLDCDDGGIDNATECAEGGDPLDSSDDCDIAQDANVDICMLIADTPNNPMATLDCDGGGVDNATECDNGGDPFDPNDDCMAAIAGDVNICVVVLADPTGPLATADCDKGGVDNITECENGGDPSDPDDDCEYAGAAGIDICAMLDPDGDGTFDTTHPWATLDCDKGGIDNITECITGDDPSNPSDDPQCPCDEAMAGTLDICALLAADPTNPIGTLDCDEGGVDNATECANNGDPLDDADDCDLWQFTGLDLCVLLAGDPDHPLANVDCDGGGVDNITECSNGEDPFDPTDDCQAAIDDGIDICAIVLNDPNGMMATQDCDSGGVDNITECQNGGDPSDPADDCDAASNSGVDICMMLDPDGDGTFDDTHPWASLDCDGGGVSNVDECIAGTDPNEPSDDPTCACHDAEQGTIDICTILAADPTNPLGTLDCDDGGIDNATECAEGGDPLDSSDDCDIAQDANVDICMLIADTPNNPMATLDCDGGGVDNATECDNGGDPFDPNDDCMAAIAGDVNICVVVLADPTGPLATADCDKGGVDNITECENGGDPSDPDDDCEYAGAAGIDICAMLDPDGDGTFDTTHPWATLDCDKGGIDNITECITGDDPSNPSDDPQCPCDEAMAGTLDICALLAADPTNPIGTLDCDEGGVDNATECANNGDPLDDADDCDLWQFTGLDLCVLLAGDPDHPLANVDCDGGGVDNITECSNGEDPFDPTDDCQAAIDDGIDICAIVLNDPNGMMATQDCDNGGVDNITECQNGGDPTDETDDCDAASNAGMDICGMLDPDGNGVFDMTHPWASLDCDGGGVSNVDECIAGTDPNDPADDPTCACHDAEMGNIDICAILDADPTNPLATLDCDEGGVDNATECAEGNDPLDSADDCDLVNDGTVDVCAILTMDPSNPLSTLDCDGGGVVNEDECNNGGDPSNPADDCTIAIAAGVDICAIVLNDPTGPLAMADCDSGGVNNYDECINGGDPSDPADDCEVAADMEMDICAILDADPTNPWATLDCDGGGVINIDECIAGTDPSNPSDDPTCECHDAEAGNIDICAILTIDPDAAIGDLDCDNGGATNAEECAAGGDPLDPADDCDLVNDGTIDVCAILTMDPANPLSTLDCDGGGVVNEDECNNGGDPSNPADDCTIAIAAGVDICAIVLNDPTGPLAMADCDSGGVNNYDECINGGDPSDPADDCEVAADMEMDICAILDADPTNPWATLDCDGGGVINIDECIAGTDPSNPSDDPTCECHDAEAGNIDICAILTIDPDAAIGDLDCDNGGATNAEECAAGGDPLDPADDCDVMEASGINICLLFSGDPNHPLATADCDGGGVTNIDECQSGEDPFDPADDCQAAIDGAIDICLLIGADPNHPLATLDCDNGGANNYDECSNGGDPSDPVDDCDVAANTGADICAVINGDPTHPWATLDCDDGGVSNEDECAAGDDPSDPGDDNNCRDLCLEAEADGTDICALLTTNPTHPLSTLDCDNGGMDNETECANGGDPNDPADDCDIADQAGINICVLILIDPNHPMASQDCDGGGVLNVDECSTGEDPFDPADDCKSAIDAGLDICAMIGWNVNHPLATADCDDGGVDNYTECQNGHDPIDPADDCEAAVDGEVDICAILTANPTHPMSTMDCDNGGVDNQTECNSGEDPLDPADDCQTIIDENIDLCALINADPNHPLATADCDNGGAMNIKECYHGQDPLDPSDDCQTILDAEMDICAIVLADPGHPLATQDCDNGGIINIIECNNGDDPTDPSDDFFCTANDPCDELDPTDDICTILAADPTNPLGTADCDKGGLDNQTECANGGDPNDPDDECAIAIAGGVDLCAVIAGNPNHPMATLDCDEGGVINIEECYTGEDPIDPSDDCDAVIKSDNVDLCDILINPDGTYHPMATMDCDNGGVPNINECLFGYNPEDASDECEAALGCGLDVCVLIGGDPNHPLADLDCDGGGVPNILECENGGDPGDPSDDCQVAIIGELNICAIICGDPNHPLATLDCDGGGMPNHVECTQGTNPGDPADDCNAAVATGIDICTLIALDPSSPYAAEDCDNGGIDNGTECANGGDPADPTDDCLAAIATGEDICAIINGDATHPMASLDCDNGGIDNFTECSIGTDPSESTDDCSAAKAAAINICILINWDPAHPLAQLDCDNGGVTNIIECSHGEDPCDPLDDCGAAAEEGVDICAILAANPTHPWASLDCDRGGVDNATECANAGDPTDPIDDQNCTPSLCEQAQDGTIDICAMLVSNPADPIGSLDCDGGGISNAIECNTGSDPLVAGDDCATAATANIDICTMITLNPSSPLATLDCDGGGVMNAVECASGEDPFDSSDDCQSAIDAGINICQLINFDPNHPLASLDCDAGGIDNITECNSGGDPSVTSDDVFNICITAVDGNADICALLSADPNHPIGAADCDNGGVTNLEECQNNNDPTDGLDDCPDLTPITTILPGNIAGVSGIGVAVEITELNGIDTDGSGIFIRIPSDPRLTFVWDPSLTSVALTPVNNTNWTYLGNNGVVHTFKYNGTGLVITGGQTEAFGFQSTYDPQATDGQTTVTASIVPFGGGECNILNDTDSERLVYFE